MGGGGHYAFHLDQVLSALTLTLTLILTLMTLSLTRILTLTLPRLPPRPGLVRGIVGDLRHVRVAVPGLGLGVFRHVARGLDLCEGRIVDSLN